MRRVLVLGGTAWLGRAIAAHAVAAGVEVVCLARGASSAVPDGARHVAADRTRPGAYDDVAAQDWDEVVEIAYEPGVVTSALAALADRAAHWTLVSTISVYADASAVGADESAAVVEPRDLTAYPDAKVAAERATRERVGERLLVARPGLIVGPGDPSDRFGCWPARMARGGRVLVPETEDRWAQVIDVDDLAAWLERAGRDELRGTVDAVGRPEALATVIDAAAAAAGFTGERVVVDDATLLAHDVAYWAGPRSLPLWLPVESQGMMRRSGAAYLAAGGTLRSLDESVERVLADEIARGLDRPRRSGLSAAEEREVLDAVRR